MLFIKIVVSEVDNVLFSKPFVKSICYSFRRRNKLNIYNE